MRWISFFWGSWKYERNRSCAKLTCSGITSFARVPLRSYFHEPQKNEIYFLNKKKKKNHLSILNKHYVYIFTSIIHTRNKLLSDKPFSAGISGTISSLRNLAERKRCPHIAEMQKICCRNSTKQNERKVIVLYISLVFIRAFEPPHHKTIKLACEPSEDSDQPGHPPSQIRVLAVRMKKSLGP